MFIRDLIYALRTLRKSPIFAATAILTIALGIGASTAIFSVANAVLLRPLPYKNPDRLVFALSDMRKRNVKDFPFSNADFLDLRNGSKNVFQDVAAVQTFRNVVPREDGSPELVRGAAVSTNFFGMMGAATVLGRSFIDADGVPQAAPAPGAAAGAAPAVPAVLVISYDFWQRRFGGKPDVLGKSLPAGGPGGTQIVGVLAPGFELLFPPDTNTERLPDIWFALRIPYDNVNRNQVQHRVIARLKDGVTLEQAQSAVDRIAAETRKNFLISGTAGYAIRLEPMHAHVVEEVRPALLALMGAVVFLLLIACANVANLLLVRASLRERELAVRTAMGGSRWALIRQTLAEAVVLACAGATFGLALAYAGISELRALAPPSLPRLDTIAIDPVVIAFTATAALMAAGLFGIVPALRASRPDVAIVLRGSSRTTGLGNAGMLRNVVVVAEVALSFVLLIGSGLMVRSFLELQRIDPGFDSGHLLTFLTLGGRRGAQPPQRAAWVRDLANKLHALPGVRSVTAATPFPLAGPFFPIRWGLAPALTDPSKFQAVDNLFVLPGYFETMHTPLIAGRGFTDADNAGDRDVVVVDQLLAAKAFPNESAIGKRILIRVRKLEPEWVEIIGVAAHVRTTSLAVAGREQVYFTDGYVDHGRVNRWALRVNGDPAQLAAQVRAAVAQHDSHMVLMEMQPMDTLVEQAQAATRFQLLLIGVFAAIAAILAGVGLYGVLATLVRQRTAEIGVRMALGAAPGGIFQLIVSHGLRLSAAGILVGLAAAAGFTRVMSSMLIGVKPIDPATYAAMAALFLVIAAIASWLPARRAAALDPTVALRGE
jgi:putative ABC transport system permease protein